MRLGVEENNVFTYLIRSSQEWAKKSVRAYRASREGVAAIEFAFVAPIMILMYLGLAELSLLIAEDRRVSHAANVAGDLTTQKSSVTKDDMSNIMNAVLLTLEEPDSSRVNIEITSYSLDTNGNIVTNGQATLGGSFGEAYSTNDIDARLLNASSGVVVARVAYDYRFSLMSYNEDTHTTAPLSKNPRAVTLTDTFLLKPRKSAQVTFDVSAGGGSTTYDCGFLAGKPSC